MLGYARLGAFHLGSVHGCVKDPMELRLKFNDFCLIVIEARDPAHDLALVEGHAQFEGVLSGRGFRP